MKVAFTYRRRRGDPAPIDAEAGAAITLEERTDYIVTFREPCSPVVLGRLADMKAELLAPHIAVLGFANFVGRTELAGVTINVASKKIGDDGVSKLLEEISELSSSLVFGWRAPTTFQAVSSVQRRTPVAFHQLQLLRHVMLAAPPGRRLQDWIAVVQRNPTRRFEPERPVVSPDRVRRLDHRAVQSMFSRLDRLVPVEQTAGANALAQALSFGQPIRSHLPIKVAAPRGRLSFDTPENRFVKHVVGECLALVYRFVDHPKIHTSLRKDCRVMLGILEEVTPMLADVGRLVEFHAPSQALAKADGYRELFVFWSDLSRHVSLPISAVETTRLLEGRDMATLYEYWVFLKVLQATCLVTDTSPNKNPQIRRDELGESLVIGLTSSVGSAIKVRFNPTYTRKNGGAYSTPLRPDVVIETANCSHAFDAKYRLDYFDAVEGDTDDGAGTYKRSDLYKMHTYRDAIGGLRTAFAVYPGSEFIFFDRAGGRHNMPGDMVAPDGVGAIPLRPSSANASAVLTTVLAGLLNEGGSVV